MTEAGVTDPDCPVEIVLRPSSTTAVGTSGVGPGGVSAGPSSTRVSRSCVGGPPDPSSSFSSLSIPGHPRRGVRGRESPVPTTVTEPLRGPTVCVRVRNKDKMSTFWSTPKTVNFGIFTVNDRDLELTNSLYTEDHSAGEVGD